ncbi:MAG: PBSX family phage terminase large subunit [Thermodesulfobacteriota bacterium]|jgi:PBSX family phage terminase large subunit|nr:PBSX family phage terminase large subunit [Thermodesulfobacteriota bacterium]
MDTKKKVKFNLLSHQYQFTESTNRYIVNSGGVGSGKTYAIVLKTLKLCIEHPGIFILIGAQTYPLLRDTTLREFVNLIPPEMIKSYNKANHHFIFENNSEVIFRSFDDPNKLKSLNLGACGIEEMSDISEEIFKMLRTRMRQDRMPCCIYGATNPGTFSNWVYRIFIENPIQNSEIIYSISADNAYLPFEYLEDLEYMKDSNPEYYERMVMGKWGALEGLIYNLPIEQRITELLRIKDYDRIIAGLDFGFTHPTALVVIGIRENIRHVISEVYRHKMTSSDIIDIVKQKEKEFNIEIIYCDSSRPEIIEDLQREGIPAVESIKDVFDGIMFIKSLIGSKKLYVNKECVFTLREMDSYIWDAKNMIKEVPLKINDHCLDSIRYACYTDHKKYAGGIEKFNSEEGREQYDW